MTSPRKTISASAPTTIVRRAPSGRSWSRAKARATTGSPTSGAIATLRSAQNARNSIGRVTIRSRRHSVAPTRERPRTRRSTARGPSQILRKSGERHSMTCDRMSPREQFDRERHELDAVGVHEHRREADRRADEQQPFAPVPRPVAVDPAPEQVQREVGEPELERAVRVRPATTAPAGPRAGAGRRGCRAPRRPRAAPGGRARRSAAAAPTTPCRCPPAPRR